MRRVGFLLCALVLLSSGCEQVQEITRADPIEAADAFIAAWNDLDFEAMDGYLVDEELSRLERMHESVFSSGAITEHEVTRTSDPELPTEEDYENGAPVVVEVPY
jgi:hypothetical protein